MYIVVYIAILILLLLIVYIKYKEPLISKNIIIYIHICQKGEWKKSFNILINSIKKWSGSVIKTPQN